MSFWKFSIRKTQAIAKLFYKDTKNHIVLPTNTALFPARIKALSFVDLSHIQIPTAVSFPEFIQSYVIAPNTLHQMAEDGTCSK